METLKWVECPFGDILPFCLTVGESNSTERRVELT